MGRLGIAITLVVLTLASTGCGGSDEAGEPAQNLATGQVVPQGPTDIYERVTAFKKGLRDLPHEVKFTSTSTNENEGIVRAEVTSKQGTTVRFAMQLIPDLDSLPAVWINRINSRFLDRYGTKQGMNGVYTAVGAYAFTDPQMGPGASKRFELENEIHDVACLLFTGEACRAV